MRRDIPPGRFRPDLTPAERVQAEAEAALIEETVMALVAKQAAHDLICKSPQCGGFIYSEVSSLGGDAEALASLAMTALELLADSVRATEGAAALRWAKEMQKSEGAQGQKDDPAKT